MPGEPPIAVADNVETQPVDIMTAIPPVPTPDRVPSPNEPADLKRERYQTKPVPKDDETRDFTESENEAVGTQGAFLVLHLFSSELTASKTK